MKNVIEINLTKNCSCDLVSNIDDGTNSVQINLTCDVLRNPKLIIDGEELKITENKYTYEFPESKLWGNDLIMFSLSDDNHSGNDFIITQATSKEGNLILKQINDVSFKLNCVKSGLKYHKKETVVKEVLYNQKLSHTVCVTDKLPFGIWLMNVRVTLRYGFQSGTGVISVGKNNFTTDHYIYEKERINDGSEPADLTVAFSFIVEENEDFSQYLHINFEADDQTDKNATGEFWIRVDAVKID